MGSALRDVTVAFLLLSVMLIVPLNSFAANDSVTASIVPTSVVGSGTFTVSGSVTAASGSITNTAVFLRVVNPTNTTVAVASANVTGSGASGTYSKGFVAGGSSNWVAGTFEVVATYGTLSSGQPATATVTFTYASATTTTTSTTATTNTTATVTTTLTTTTTSVSTTTSTVTATMTTTSVSVQTSTVTSTTTSTTTTSAIVLTTNEALVGGVALLVLIIALVGLAVVRRR